MVVRERLRALWICLALALGTWLLYWPVGSFDFINFDDPAYVSGNPHIQQGLTWPSFIWCFQAGYASNWHPLTWLTHILDWSLYGPKAGGHHLTNLALHIANTLLLFVVLRQMTSAFWRSAAVAALFAWHPMHVESVAWIAERKDVLCTLFFMLTLWAYHRYAKGRIQTKEGRRQKAESGNTQPTTPHTQHETPPTPHVSGFTFHVSRFYLLSLLFFALGLMAKPMLVTLPFVLLLLDWWPLRRFPRPQIRSALPSPGWQALLLEKVPFLALAAVAGVLTMIAQTRGGAVWSLEAIPPGARIINASVSYLGYIQKMFWPTGLAEFYPVESPWPPARVAAAVLCLAGISFLALWFRKTRPYLAVGWCWFLGTLVPVIGFVQVGFQSMADRYTYIPYIGLFVAVCWALGEMISGWRYHRAVLASLSIAALAALGAATSRQVQYWQNGGTLCSHTLAVNGDNCVSLCSLGGFYYMRGQLAQAQDQLERALRIAPRYSPAHNLLGHVFLKQGKVQDAIAQYQAALADAPSAVEPLLGLGNIALRENHPAEAVRHYTAAVQADPSLPGARFVLGKALLLDRKPAEAEQQFAQALRLQPNDAQTHYHLGLALAVQAKWLPAIEHYRTALRLRPNFPDAHFYLAVALADQQQWQEAAEHYSQALSEQPQLARAHLGLARALVALGKTAGALAQFEAAIKAQPDSGEVYYELGNLLMREGKTHEVMSRFTAVLKSRPEMAEAHYFVGIVLRQQGKAREAAEHWRRAVKSRPDWVEVLNNLAWLLATCPDAALRNGPEAFDLAQRAVNLTGGRDAGLLDTLAATQAEIGHFAEAAQTSSNALALATAAKDAALVQQLEQHLRSYQNAQAFRE